MSHCTCKKFGEAKSEHSKFFKKSDNVRNSINTNTSVSLCYKMTFSTNVNESESLKYM